MPRTSSNPNAPVTPNSLGRSSNPWPRFYAMWCKERRALELPCNIKLAGKEWKALPQSEKDKYAVRCRGVLELPEVTEASDHFTEDEGSADGMAGSEATPVKLETQLPVSPLFSEHGPYDGPSVLDNFLLEGSSALRRAPSIGPSPVVHGLPFSVSTNGIPDLGPSFSVVEEHPIAGPSSTPLPAPLPSYPLPDTSLFTEEDLLQGEAAYEYLESLQASTIDPRMLGWLNFGSGLPSAAAPPMTGDSGPPTSVHTTPTTGYTQPGLVTPGFTPWGATQDLPVELGDNQFGFNGVDGAAQEQFMWNGYQDSEYVPQQPLAPPYPILPTSGPAPAVMEQYNQAGMSWAEIARVLEGDQPHAIVPPPLPVQNASLDLVEQALEVVNVDKPGMDGSPLRPRLMMVQLWFNQA
jgi:hypothetical protein